MNNDMRGWGCAGNGCPKQDNCARFLENQERPYIFSSAPFNYYNYGDHEEFRCGYQEYPKKHD